MPEPDFQGRDSQGEMSFKPMAPVLAMRGIRKSFAGVEVLHGVDLTLNRGEVLALLGENGAGKSTLIKILNGDYTKDAGEIFIKGKQVDIKTPRDAEQAGVKMIYQELNYVPDLTVAENILIGHLPHKAGPLGAAFVDRDTMHQRAQIILDNLSVEVNSRRSMRTLSVGQQQAVEIGKALATQAQIIVMDEPTAALTQHEVGRLFETINLLRQQGVAIIFISHRLDEVEQIAQRVTVLRDGLVVGTERVADVGPREIVRMMIGHDLQSLYPSKQIATSDTILEVDQLSRHNSFTNISFTVKAGEIVGLFGLLGAGQADVLKALFGILPADSGEIKVHGVPMHITSPTQAKAANIGYVSDDRKVDSLLLDMNVAENLTVANWTTLFRSGLVRQERIRERAAHWMNRLSIRSTKGYQQPVRTLSGGNQQKIILARWLEAGSQLLLLNEPTRGVDVGARADIYALLENLRETGLGLVVVSSDLEEVFGICNRIIVIAKGHIVNTFVPSQTSKEELLVAAAGGAL